MNNQKELFLQHWFETIQSCFPFITLNTAFWISCQFALESDFGKSPIALDNQNYGGMKLPKLRPTTAECENRGHASYCSPIYFLFDYFLLLSYARITQEIMQDLDRFKLALSKIGYCPNKDYIASVDKIFNQYYSLTL